MAWTSADLTAIEKAIATGARRVRFQTHEVEYHSAGEMLRVRDAIKAAIEPASSSGGVMIARYSDGFE